MLVYCGDCVHKNEPKNEGECAECGLKHEYTNADKIRDMTDEELADELLEWYAVFSVVEWSKEMILDWLKQEAAEGERWTQSNT